jgi:hypothetical protein
MIKIPTIKEWKKPNLIGLPQNRTTQFMLPALGLQSEKTGYKLLKYFGFINCYLDHKDGPEDCATCLYLVFNPPADAFKKFPEFYQVYKAYPNFVSDYVLDDQLIVLVFKVRDKWKETLNAFKRSKYSQMSKEYAEMFKRPTMAGTVVVSDEYYIIHKNKDYKQQLEEQLSIITKGFRDIVVIDDNAELMSPLEEAKEIFNYEIQY